MRFSSKAEDKDNTKEVEIPAERRNKNVSLESDSCCIPESLYLEIFPGEYRDQQVQLAELVRS